MSSNKKLYYGSEKKIESVTSMDEIKRVHPKYAEHMYTQNRIVEAFAMSNLGGTEILDQPICGKCEKPGMNTINPNFVSSGDIEKDVEVRNCYCESCGSTTYNTLTLRNYMLNELNVKISEIQNIENKIEGGSKAWG
jgi:hypothetical protein